MPGKRRGACPRRPPAATATAALPVVPVGSHGAGRLPPSTPSPWRCARLWVWRGYCGPCDASHALLPDFVVPHHLDSLDRIFASLDPRVTVDVPASTRRGWQARFRRNRAIFTSGCAAAVVALRGELGELHVDSLLLAVWATIRRRSDRVPPPWRILNIMSGGSWIRERVNSSWTAIGSFPLPP